MAELMAKATEKTIDKKLINSLEFQDLSFGFSGYAPILEKVNFAFPMNCNVLVNGKSGSGKSMLVRLFAGLCSPTAGRFLINGKNLEEMTFEEFLPLRLKIGYSFDMGGLLSNRTLRENLWLPMRYHKLEESPALKGWVDELIKIFDLSAAADLRPAAVTGAARKACCVARAFALKPELLLLDDPINALSRPAVRALANLIHQGQIAGWLKHVYVAAQSDEDSASSISNLMEIFDTQLVVDADLRKVVAA